MSVLLTVHQREFRLKWLIRQRSGILNPAMTDGRTQSTQECRSYGDPWTKFPFASTASLLAIIVSWANLQQRWLSPAQEMAIRQSFINIGSGCLYINTVKLPPIGANQTKLFVLSSLQRVSPERSLHQSKRKWVFTTIQ